MKNGERLISHLFDSSRWKQHRCTTALFKMLPPSLQSGVSFAKFHNKVLIIALKSHAFKAEFYHKRAVIKSIFLQLRSVTNICEDFEIDSFKLFVHQEKELSREVEKTIHYQEIADGDFDNMATDEKLKEIFEKIRKDIKNSTKST